jgi:hypothetical protein
MRQTFALIAVGMILLIAWAIAVQAARAASRAHIRRRQRLQRLCSVVTGTPPAPPECEPSSSQPDARPVLITRLLADSPLVIGKFAAAAEVLARNARN